MSAIGHEPVPLLNGFEVATSTPLGALDLIAIAPFILAAMAVALVRKLRRGGE